MPKVCLDYESHKSKPINAAQISERIGGQVENISIKELAKYIVDGRTWTPARFNPPSRKNENWAGQTVFALDFDTGTTWEEVLTKCKKYKITPAFIYLTFSCINNDRFRVVFVLPFEVVDVRIRNAVQLGMLEIFHESDQSCKDAARCFFGGKEIVYSDYQATIDIAHVIETVGSYHQLNDRNNNAQRKIRNYCESTGLDMVNGLPKIEINPKLTEIPPHLYKYYRRGDKSVTYSIYKYEENISPDELVVIYFNQSLTKESAKGGKKQKHTVCNEIINRETVRKVDFDRLSEMCRLYREFTSGEYWAYHNEIFGIATNLLSAEGGRKRFFRGITSREEYDFEKWLKYANYINKKVYLPESCDRYCPFCDKCDHGRTMIETVKLIMGRVNVKFTPKFISLEEGEKRLREEIVTAYQNNDMRKIIIKAETGLGKTAAYINLPGYKTIAVPTHNLKNEISARMTEPHVIAPSLPSVSPYFNDRIKSLYEVGAYTAAGMLIKNSAVLHPELERYVQQVEALQNTNETVITTHERLLYTIDDNQIIIIDEDPIRTLLKQGSVTIKDLYDAIARMPENVDQRTMLSILENVRKVTPGNVGEMSWGGLIDKQLVESMVTTATTIKSNVLGFLECDYFIKNDDGSINFIVKRALPRKKTIILSATADITISKYLYGNDLDFIDIGRVRSIGQIIQYNQKSFSRFQMKKDNNLKKLARSLVKDSPVITFKEFRGDFENCVATFGGLEGIDKLGGSNLFVVGTPHLHPNVYLLYAYALGLKPKTTQMDYIPVIRNGLEFYFFTFLDEELKNIQLWLVESELMQAIGRARIIRNDCTVTVLSNFALVGAEYRHLKKQEIKDLIGEEE